MTTTQAPLRRSLGAVMKITFKVEPGTPPEFAEYLRVIASNRLVALAAWADVREKAVRLRRDSQVHVEVYKPEVITARVEGDHGTYYTTVQRLGAYPGGPSKLRESSISGWSCECEWGQWAWIRKRTFVGRMCSHALALTYEMQSRDHQRRRTRGQPIRVRQGPSTPGGTGQATRTRMTLSSANRNSWRRQANGTWSFVTDDPHFPTASIMKVGGGYKAEVWPDGLSIFSLSVGTFRNSEGARRAVARVINATLRGQMSPDESLRAIDDALEMGRHPESRPASTEVPSQRGWRDPDREPPVQEHDFLEGVRPGSKMNLTFHDLTNQSHREEPALFHGITGRGEENQRAHFTSWDHQGQPYDWEAYMYRASPDELDDLSNEPSEDDMDDDEREDLYDNNPSLRDYRDELQFFRDNLGHLYDGRARWSFGSGADPLEGHVIEGPSENYRTRQLPHEGSRKFADEDHKVIGRPIPDDDEDEKDEGIIPERRVVGKYRERLNRSVTTMAIPHLSGEGWLEEDQYLDRTSDYTHGYDDMGNSLAPEDSYDDMVADGSDEVTGMMDRVDRSTSPQTMSSAKESFWSFADEGEPLGVSNQNLQEDPQTNTDIVEDNLDHGDAPFIEDFDRGKDSQDFWGGEEFTSQSSTKVEGNHPLAHRIKHGGTGIQRQSGKDYSIAEQQALVDEPGVARNAGQLRLEGTHYSQETEESPLDFMF